MTVLDKKIVSDIENESVTQTPAQMAAYLQKSLGQNMAAYLLGLSDKKQVSRYISEKHKPHAQRLVKLQTGFRVVKAIDRVYDTETARAWLFGTNTRLDDRAPIGLIRETSDVTKLAAVWRAARQFASADI